MHAKILKVSISFQQRHSPLPKDMIGFVNILHGTNSNASKLVYSKS